MFGKSNKRLAEKQLQLVLKYQRVFESEEGKEVLQDLCSRSFVFDSTFDENPSKAAFKEGQRSTILEIFKVLKIDYVKFKESIDKEFETTEE
jgi:hypothetical protein